MKSVQFAPIPWSSLPMEEPESIELMWMNFYSEFRVIHGDCGQNAQKSA